MRIWQLQSQQPRHQLGLRLQIPCRYLPHSLCWSNSTVVVPARTVSYVIKHSLGKKVLHPVIHSTTVNTDFLKHLHTTNSQEHRVWIYHWNWAFSRGRSLSTCRFTLTGIFMSTHLCMKNNLSVPERAWHSPDNSKSISWKIHSRESDVNKPWHKPPRTAETLNLQAKPYPWAISEDPMTPLSEAPCQRLSMRTNVCRKNTCFYKISSRERGTAHFTFHMCGFSRSEQRNIERQQEKNLVEKSYLSNTALTTLTNWHRTSGRLTQLKSLVSWTTKILEHRILNLKSTHTK